MRSCFTKGQLYTTVGFIFKNYSSFVNPSLHLILFGDGVYVRKTKTNMASCHEVAYKLLVEWLPRELTIIETGNEGL